MTNTEFQAQGARDEEDPSPWTRPGFLAAARRHQLIKCRDRMARTDFAGASDEGRAAAAQSDGRLIAAGVSTVSGRTADFALARYNANGSLDPAFGQGGKVTTDFADGHGRLWWLELEEAITRLDRVVLRGHGALRDLPSRTVVEKRAAFEAIYRHLRAGPEERLRPVTADLAAQAGVDTRRLTANLCLGWDELQTLVREPDVLIGAHTLSHPILAKCDGTTAMREIAESKELLGRRLGRPVRHLAYPFGDASAVGPREFRFARQAGYVTAITSRPAHVFPDHAAHPHALPRTSVNGLFQNTRALRALLSGVPFWIWNGRRILKIESQVEEVDGR